MKKILIANRGEIALRIIRACRDAGYISIAVAPDADRESWHAHAADEVRMLPGSAPLDTYLNQNAIIEIARESEADAIHPGYGLLSENDEFAAAVEKAGLIWIGPPPEAIVALGNKVQAREIARRAGAPILPSLQSEWLTIDAAQSFVSTHGVPVIIKAENGGGGRGMRIVRHESELESHLQAAETEANLAFGQRACFIEKYIETARHVETQCLADTHGNIVVLGTRDCTVQRRQQKLIEEAPAPFLTEEQNALLIESSRRILAEAGYRGAGTCEFLLTRDGNLYFLEVNTRIQVEHPVTEEATGIDIVREMFRIMEGEAVNVDSATPYRHSMEFRINAEDPFHDFVPSPGLITTLHLPTGPGIRLDFGYRHGDTVPPYYDSLLGKLIVTGQNRKDVVARARRAFSELSIGGVSTVVPLHRAILECDEFVSDVPTGFSVSTGWVDRELRTIMALASRSTKGTVEDEVQLSSPEWVEIDRPDTEGERQRDGTGILAPLSGTVIEIRVSEGERIDAGDVVAVMEAMKMETTVVSEFAGTVRDVRIAAGCFVENGTCIIEVE